MFFQRVSPKKNHHAHETPTRFSLENSWATVECKRQSSDSFETISELRGTGLCRDNCHNDWNILTWLSLSISYSTYISIIIYHSISLYIILYHLYIYISLYIILDRTAPGQREIFRGSASLGALGFFLGGQSPMSPLMHPQVFGRKRQSFSIFSTFFSSHFDWHCA